MKIILPISLLLSMLPETRGEFGWGWCKDHEKTPKVDLDVNRFAGDWYELRREYWHDWGSDQHCTVSNFQPVNADLLLFK